MPYLQVTYPAGALDPTVRPRLAEDLTTTFMRWEGAPDNDFFRAACWVYFNEMPADAVNRGGAPAVKPTYRVEATVPAGAMSARRKAGPGPGRHRAPPGCRGGRRSRSDARLGAHHRAAQRQLGRRRQIIDFEQLREAARAARDTATAS
jgi:phenylpyruvate tautomerase PptA (4-oxalocrotonate tautomerase family)